MIQAKASSIDDYFVIFHSRLKVISVVFMAIVMAFVAYAFFQKDRFRCDNDIEVLDPNKDPLRQGIVKTVPFQRRLGLIKARMEQPLTRRKIISAVDFMDKDLNPVKYRDVEFPRRMFSLRLLHFLESIDEQIRKHGVSAGFPEAPNLTLKILNQNTYSLSLNPNRPITLPVQVKITLPPQFRFSNSGDGERVVEFQPETFDQPIEIMIAERGSPDSSLYTLLIKHEINTEDPVYRMIASGKTPAISCQRVNKRDMVSEAPGVRDTEGGWEDAGFAINVEPGSPMSAMDEINYWKVRCDSLDHFMENSRESEFQLWEEIQLDYLVKWAEKVKEIHKSKKWDSDIISYGVGICEIMPRVKVKLAEEREFKALDNAKPLKGKEVDRLKDILQTKKSEDQFFKEQMTFLSQKLKIVTGKINTIKVSIESEDARLAKLYVDAAVGRFVRESESLKEEEILGALKLYQDQYDDTKKEIRDLSGKLQVISNVYPEDATSLIAQVDSKDGSVRYVSGSSQAELQTLYMLKEEYRKTQMNLIDVQAELERNEKAILDTPEYILESTTETRNPLSQSLEQKLSELKRDLNILLIDATTDHPLVKQHQREIATLEARLREIPQFSAESQITKKNPIHVQLDSSIHSLRIHVDAYGKSMKRLVKDIEKQYIVLKNNAERVQDIASIQKDYDRAQLKLDTYSQRLRDAEVTKRLELENEGTKFNVSEAAEVPRRAVAPQRWLIILMGAMVAMFVTITVVFVLEYLDHSIKDVSDAKRFVDLPILGAISKLDLQEAEIKLKSGSGAMPQGSGKLDGERKTFWDKFSGKK